MLEKTYAEGLIEGRVLAAEETIGKHGERLDGHSRRLRSLEKIAWIILGALMFIQGWPVLATFLNVAAQ